MRHIAIVIFLFLTSSLFAQQGKIRGTVYDDGSGETLVGVSVIVKGTTTGTATDLDGEFSLNLEPGTYDLEFSFISFQSMTIEDVEVKEDEVTNFNNISLKESSVELEDVVVTASMVRNNEAALQTMKRKSSVMLDGISAAKMQLIGDGTAVEAAKRVTGVTVENGKYIYVRGLGDRYSKTTLNNVDIPGLDPDRNSLQMDIFPTNLINNMMVSKNFSAERPADFTGGLMNVETKDFPERKIFNVSVSTSFNPDMHFNPDYLSYEGGNTDFLGFDDGTRALPERARQSDIPSPFSGHSTGQVENFINSFNPQLAAKRQQSFMDYSLGIAYGDQIDLNQGNNKPKLGYILSLTYKSEQKYFDDMAFGAYQKQQDPDNYELQYATRQSGENGQKNILAGLLGGLAYKNNFNKYRLTAMHLQNGESTAGIFNIDNNSAAVGQSGYRGLSHTLEYNERSLTNVLLNGTHNPKDSGWEVDWRLSPTFSTSSEPDIRNTTFTLSENRDPNFNAGAGGFPTRRWRELTELNTTAKIDITKAYNFNEKDAVLKFGASHAYKERDYEILSYNVKFGGSMRSFPEADPSLILQPENLYPNDPYNISYQSGNSDPNPNAYSSNVNNTALYISNEFFPLRDLKATIGVRVENYIQRHTGRDQRYASGDTRNGRNLDNEKVLESTDFFPSVNLTWALNEDQNIRGAYSKTIARPSFKELSFAQILDPVSNRIFNGSLFDSYSDWDGNLTETRIDNLDLRWEHYFEDGQNASASIFYKKFEDPIELVRIPEQQTSTEYQPRNVGDGTVYGAEFEFTKSLHIFSPLLRNFSTNGNVTFVKSKIDMTESEYRSRKNFEKTDENIENTREMAGQSPYVINAGLSYNDSNKGLDAGVFYNVKGPTLTIVGGGLFPDIYSEPFHSLNFNLNKKFGEDQKTTVDIKISNLLNEKRESFFKAYEAQKQIYNQINPGRSISIGLSYKF
ncbi:MAG: TonB-dependent receptor domain-containing protein [Bacteroidota bacterium]